MKQYNIKHLRYIIDNMGYCIGIYNSHKGIYDCSKCKMMYQLNCNIIEREIERFNNAKRLLAEIERIDKIKKVLENE